jgi:hypothetical protein
MKLRDFFINDISDEIWKVSGTLKKPENWSGLWSPKAVELDLSQIPGLKWLKYHCIG